MTDSKYLLYSIVVHLCLFLSFIFNFPFSSSRFVFENTNENDIISAVILGDSVKSHILTEPAQTKRVDSKNKLLKTKTKTKDKIVTIPIPEKKIISKITKDLLVNDLLTDIKKINNSKKVKKQMKKDLEKSLKEQSEQTLRQELMNEKIKLTTAQARKSQGIINKYKSLILQAISENWIVPSEIDQKLSCSVMIRLAPDGNVMDVQITRSSGDPSLDSSVRAAILKASPLPVPENSQDFETFRQFILKVKPENLLKA